MSSHIGKMSVFLLLICMKLHSYTNPWEPSVAAELEKNRNRLSKNSLNRYAKAKYTQYGEEGIITEIFRRLNIEKGFFVEFGAMDGIDISNTRSLWEKGWKGVMIEPSEGLFKALKHNYPPGSGVLTLNSFVDWKRDRPDACLFDDIRRTYFPHQEIDFLSIDIDGADFYILRGLECRPKVIAIETNLYWHPMIDEEVPEDLALGNRQQPIQVIIKLAKEMGYEPIGMTINLFLVRQDLFAPFSDITNDYMTLWRDAFRALPIKSTVPQIVQAYNGVDYHAICPITEEF